MRDQPTLFSPDAAGSMRDFEQILLSNSGEDAFESAVKLLAAKLVAEIEGIDGKPGGFKLYDSPELTHKHIQVLYQKALRMWPTLNGGGHELDITPEHLVRSLRPLLGWHLISSDLSHLDATLERLVAKSSKGELGQYFTPRDVIRFCVKVLHPSSLDTIIDPACGSAGFLFEASRQSIVEFKEAPRCLGIDFGTKAVKVATLLGLASQQFSISVTKANSLDGRAYVESYPQAWEPFLMPSTHIGKDSSSMRWGAWGRLQCSLLFTNPPFAGDIDDAAMLAAYDATKTRLAKKAVSREHLFVERAVRLLSPGGRMAIVLPQGLLANSSACYLRRWLYNETRILGVVGLHPFTFLPNTGVKTSILFLERRHSKSTGSAPYDIFFATSKLPGKDSSGKRTGPSDFGDIATAFMSFLSKQEIAWAKKTTPNDFPNIDSEVVQNNEVIDADRLDAEYYDPNARRILKRMLEEAKGTIRKYTDSKSIQKFRGKDHAEIGYIDISSVDNRTGLVTPNLILSAEAPGRASYIVQPGDVLVSTVRPDRGTVALVTKFENTTLVASNGFCVLRPKDIEPEVLFAFCKSRSFRTVLARAATASMYPTVSDVDIFALPFPLPNKEMRMQISRNIQSALSRILDSYDTMKAAIGSITEF